MKTICQTLDVRRTTKKENKENQTFYASIKDYLPKPNPLLIQQQQFNKMNSVLPLKQNYLDTNEQFQQLSGYCNAIQNDQEIKQNKVQTLQEFVKPFKLIYQKFQPQQQQSLYSTLLYPNDSQFDEAHYIQAEDNIKFDSLFESGNLFQVFKKSDRDYILILQNDINTKGYNQWFYFSVTNKTQFINNIRINIININKDMVFYKQGMKIFVNEFNQWRKDSLNLTFKKNNIQRSEKLSYYTLSFNYTFIETGQVYFASNYPYTYTNLLSYIKSKVLIYDDILKIKTITQTQAGNDLQVITITNSQQNNDIQKTGLLFIGRQHPGETQSSFIIEGLINALLSQEASEIRNQYVIKIIPMLNIDGVIHGNQRCSLAGYDLNRKWGKNIDEMLNTVEKYIQHFNDNYQIKHVLDIHGHSKKLGAFFYGQQKNSFIDNLCKNNKKFSLENSRFMKSTKYLNNTARVFLSRILNNNPNVYTLEISYYGYKENNLLVDFTINDYREMGKSITFSFLETDIDQISEDNIEIISQVSQSDSDASIDQINLEELKNELQEISNINFPQNIDQIIPKIDRSSSQKPRVVKTSQSKHYRAKSYSIQNTIKQCPYNFVDNSQNVTKLNNNENYEHTAIFVPLQKPKQSEYSIIQPLVIMPSHSLKHQFLLQNKAKPQGTKFFRQNHQFDSKEQKDLKTYYEFKDYVTNKLNNKQLQKYSFNDTDLFKKVQARKGGFQLFNL